MKRIIALLLAMLMLGTLYTGALAAEMTDGVYVGQGKGFGGNIEVTVTIEGGKITAVEPGAHQETAGISDGAFAQLPQAIIDAQSAEVDGVSGCTFSSDGIKAAVQDALNQAMGIEAEEEEAMPIIEDPDVLVIGAGVAGMRSAIKACESGAKVVILEKTDRVGGTLGGGTLIGVNSVLQKESGIEDDPELLIGDFERLNAGYQSRNPDVEYSWNKDLGVYFANHCGEEVDWVTSLGIEFTNRTPSQPTLYEPLSVDRVSSCKRSSLTDVVMGELQKYIDAGQASIVFNTPATELITDESGAVIGAKTDSGDFYAKATILCTGGYGYSEELVKRYNLENFTTTSSWFTTGDGMLMAEKVGAVLTNMDFLTVYAGGLKTPESGLTRSLSIRVKDFPYIIFVNKDGNRFVDELGNEDGSSYDEITSWWKVGDNKVYIMLDQAMVDDLKAQEKPIITGDKDWANFDDQLAKGNILFSGSTIEEVAEKAGINAENLAATIEKYNTCAKNGLDEEFGRTRLMKEFTGGTYYIFETTPYIMITAGGPAMTDKGEVVDADGNPIPGLYQAGEIVGMANAFGRTTIGGVGNTGSLVWGALAGGSAAAYALGK